MEFVPGYRAAYAPKRNKPVMREVTPESTVSDGAQHRAPAPEPKEGNGHVNRLDADAPKPFDYGSGLEGQLENPSVPVSSAQDSGRENPHGVTPNLRLAIVADPLSQQSSNLQADAPACDVCGSITVRSGTCYKCLNCGNSMGCS
jgi:ribonucleoside-diphosphate reductase alpha chain